ncbi:MAG: pyridoxine 5'-phosphate synthase [Trichlorobacter sp.]|jgi:pyridoxine 5-phosphate synthase
MPKLGLNVDHVATVRQARGGMEPDPVTAAAIGELAGAEGITVHLREDRRHIQDRDLELLRQTIKTRLNLEMAATGEMVSIAARIKPEQCTLVPEKRQELTTEGGLDVLSAFQSVSSAVHSLKKAGIIVSLFVDPNPDQIRAAKQTGADAVEIHTGAYAEARDQASVTRELAAIRNAVELGNELGMTVHAGHGLNYVNIGPLAGMPGIEEFNIGHSIIARAVLVGLDRAVREMVALVRQ